MAGQTEFIFEKTGCYLVNLTVCTDVKEITLMLYDCYGVRPVCYGLPKGNSVKPIIAILRVNQPFTKMVVKHAPGPCHIHEADITIIKIADL